MTKLQQLLKEQEEELKNKFENLHNVQSWGNEACDCKKGSSCNEQLCKFIEKYNAKIIKAACQEMVEKKKRVHLSVASQSQSRS